MSGFAPDWLRLREFADHRSRDPALLEKLRVHFADRSNISVVDLGSGLGSNLRATAPALAPRQHWLLVDHDADLLAAAGAAIAGWADSAKPTAHGLTAVKAGRTLQIAMKQHDLAADPAPWAAGKADLVTASALFDLVSESWIARFVAALTRARLPLYAVLTHDGEVEWSPRHPADEVMKAAFVKHFARDKGFGPAAGARAATLLAERLNEAGYKVMPAPSPWQLGAQDRPLGAAFAEGWAAAVRETGDVDESTIAAWLAARTADGAGTVSHIDLLAFPR